MLAFLNDWFGVFPIIAGIHGLLMAYGVLPRNPGDLEKARRWRRKYGRLMKIVGPVLIGYGVVDLLGFLD
ncbi:MAG: hypothetical protein K9L28_11150 [Synergistales bacterium]|nr:hypothetical protein [Synergistales bacterium]